MAYRIPLLLFLVFLINATSAIKACSVLYYVDSVSGKIYVVNNEDYWYDVDAYVKIEPASKNEFARLYYGWDKFAQGGINEHGLFFDGAVSPEQPGIEGYGNPNSNLGDELLASCQTVDEAVEYLEKRKVALTNAHMMFGDKNGNAAIVEWVKGKQVVHSITNNRLIMTNYLLADTSAGNYPCYRYNSIEQNILDLEAKQKAISLLEIGNTFNKAAQAPQSSPDGRVGGTLYTSFINISDMDFVLSYKLSNEHILKLNLREALARKKKLMVYMKEI